VNLDAPHLCCPRRSSGGANRRRFYLISVISRRRLVYRKFAGSGSRGQGRPLAVNRAGRLADDQRTGIATAAFARKGPDRL
jgi:hypothetical protein